MLTETHLVLAVWCFLNAKIKNLISNLHFKPSRNKWRKQKSTNVAFHFEWPSNGKMKGHKTRPQNWRHALIWFGNVLFAKVNLISLNLKWSVRDQMDWLLVWWMYFLPVGWRADGKPYIIVDYVPVWALFKSDTSTKLIAPKKCRNNQRAALKSHIYASGQWSGNRITAF